MSDAATIRLEAEIEGWKQRFKTQEEKSKEDQKVIAELKAEVDRKSAGQRLAIAALKAGVHLEALDDVVRRALDEGWTMEKGEPVQLDPQTSKQVYGMTGSYLTAEEWIENKLKPKAPYYFGGGGFGLASAQQDDGTHTGPNPWKKETWDDTAQAAVYRESPEKAKRLAKAAGSYIGALKPRS
jgi:hypothetical protein